MAIHPAAIGIILNTDKTSVLLVKRKDIPLWVLPGGGIDDLESPEQAVIREVHEETGLKVAIERHCAEYTPINKLAAFTSLFICQAVEGQITPSSETEAVQFFNLQSLPSSFFFLHRDWLQDSLYSSILVKKPIAQITYLNLFKYFLSHPLWVMRFAYTRFKTKK